MRPAQAGARAALSAAAIAAVAGLLLYGFLAAESEKTVGLVLAGAVVVVAGGPAERRAPPAGPGRGAAGGR